MEFAPRNQRTTLNDLPQHDDPRWRMSLFTPESWYGYLRQLGSGGVMRAMIVIIGCCLGVTQPAEAAGTIYYGSRVGMVVDVVAMAGRDTARAVIRTRHTRANATAFCRDYIRKITAKCIDDELAIALNDQVTADCSTGEFTDFGGNRFRFAGASKDTDSMVGYRIIDMRTGEEADGSSVSGYSVNLDIYKALCPEHYYRAEGANR